MTQRHDDKTPQQILESIEGLVDQARPGEARALVEAAIAEAGAEAPPLGDALYAWQLRRWQLLLGWGEISAPLLVDGLRALIDEAATMAVFDEAPAMRALLAQAHARLVWVLARMRCATLAEDALTRAQALLGARAEFLVARAQLAYEFDRWPEAREFYEQALAVQADERLRQQAQLGLASTLFTLGEFDAAHAALQRVAPSMPARKVEAAHLRAALCAVRDDAPGEIAAWKEAIAAQPDLPEHLNERINLAMALGLDGQYDAALDALMHAWRLAPDSPAGRFARARIERLEGGEDVGPARRLTAFPTTRQRRDYCGPATLELCFRFIGLELRQDEIARDIKREHGTPLYEMVRYVRERDIAVRRIEATPELIRRAIDLGVPVIVQEEYATTSHVAVITGYDARLGVFITQDPMTHRPSLRAFEWSARAGDLYGNGGLLVLGRNGDPATLVLQQKADAAGLCEAEHLSILDACDRQWRDADGSGSQDALASEIIALATRALQQRHDFKFAWHRRGWALLALYRRQQGPQLRERLRQEIFEVRVRFAGDAWTHLLQGWYLFEEQRYREAWVCFFDAHQLDRDNPESLVSMATASLAADDIDPAIENLLESLRLDPSYMRAWRSLVLADRQLLLCLDAQALEAREEQADAAQPDDALRFERARVDFESALTVSAVESAAPTDDEYREAIARRLELAGKVAGEQLEEPLRLEVEALLRLRAHNFSGARDVLQRILELDAHSVYAQCALGMLALQDEDFAAGVAPLRSVLERAPELGWAGLRLSEALVQLGESDEAAQVLCDTLVAAERAFDPLLDALFSLWKTEGSTEAAGAKVRDLVAHSNYNPAMIAAAARLLERKDQVGHAIGLWRDLVAQNPYDVNALHRLGALLVRYMSSREEGIAILEDALAMAPQWHELRCVLGYALAGADPERAAQVLEPALEGGDPYAHGAYAYLLFSAGEAERAGAMIFDVAAAYQHNPHEGLIYIGYQQLRANRYDWTIELTSQVDRAQLDEKLIGLLDELTLSAYRLAGRFAEVIDAVRERYGEEPMNEWVSHDVYYGARTMDHALTARAADRYAELCEDDSERFIWQLNAAEARAELGDFGPIEALAADMPDDTAAWAHLAFAWDALHREALADQAAQRAMALDPENREALMAMEEAAVRQGDIDGAFACAEALLTLHPFEHQGPERLGILHAKSGAIDEALHFSALAVDAAPYCHISHRSRAVACFMAEDFDAARAHADQALLLNPLTEPDPDDDSLMILRALDGDLDGLERCLAHGVQVDGAEFWALYNHHLRTVARHATA